ncbi:MAG: GDP-L-fucose synthase [Proteobacteria bacterium]|nr:GDP-L-fucose synthase [Pseudomonadota bacterium]
MKIKILITGGNGLVGRNFREHPTVSDFELLAPSSKELNLLDYGQVVCYLKEQQPDLIIHAAGRVGGIEANMREPVRFFLDNLDMGRNLVWAARQQGVARLVNLGSSCMYPRNAINPLQEEMILQGELEPTNEGYALAKVATARLCQYISREDAGYAYKTLIPCNLYGRHDNFDPASSHLIPAVIHKMHQARQENRETVEIWGDGLARREFMYAGDLANCLVKAVYSYETLPEMMNVGTGKDFTVLEYYQTVAEVVGFRGKFVHNLAKPVGMKRKLVAVDRAQAWGWTAQTTLRQGIEQAYDYYLQEWERNV